ncbi:MAG: hypothetical protein P8R31_12000 [Mariniblastus sp.]|nr:hypothetical protein [Mariniblastus sp.]
MLGIIWVSQAVIGILFRKAAEHDSMVRLSAVALTLYVFWQVLKTVTRKPFEPHEWTDAEKEILLAAPISPHQLVSFRLTGLAVGTFVKALFVSIILLPDLPIWPIGFIGLFLGLVFIEFFRVCFELIFMGISPRLRWVCRGSAFVMLLGPIAIIWYRTLIVMNSAATQDLPMSILLFKSILVEMNAIVSSKIGVGVLSVMASFSEAIFTQAFSVAGLLNLLKITLITGASGALVYRLDQWSRLRAKQQESLAVRKGSLGSIGAFSHASASMARIRVPLRINGMGAVAWRQLVGAYHYRMTLSISLGIPAVLCWCPLFLDSNPEVTLVSVVGGLLFYSFLLLPSALVLDFRRDIDRFDVLKSLPVATIWLAIGQLATPVILATGFQAGVLFVATVFSSIIWSQAILAGVILVGFNLLIFTGENLIFLLSPYRRNQEGLDVFIRTVLTFTGKGIVFAVAVSALLFWATLSVLIVSSLGLSAGWAVALFCAGLLLMMGTVEALLLVGLVRLFDRFDPSEDCPALN